ncbi:YitT family protein [Sporomusa termitida]|uniref:Putative 5xTM membrane BCR, YitT family n=1 Tax=Sporomusa termitida TaxID=2377 RepID=A0A517DYZ0_9FIRM|nr:YitT family protein [Sporomusa termitida]QDR82538.1 putative 5xTM membrane BCR, YitT family [Sporomusa termitida]
MHIFRKILNVILGCGIVCGGVIFLSHSQLVTGGTTGIALGITYLFHTTFAVALLVTSIPFYLLSIFRMGWQFTLSTFFAVLTLALFTEINRWLPDFILPGYMGAIAGGGLLGLGLSLLFWNGASLGGVNVLALYLQKRFGCDPGRVTFWVDGSIVVAYFYSVGAEKGLYSILSVLITSAIISYFKGRIAAATQKNAC